MAGREDISPLVRRIARDQTQLVASTVALVIHDGKPSADSYRGLATGVPVRIGKRFFMLTAGHAAQDVKGKTISAVHSLRQASVFTPTVVDQNWKYKPSANQDWGYVEFADQDRTEFEARSMIVRSLKRL